MNVPVRLLVWLVVLLTLYEGIAPAPNARSPRHELQIAMATASSVVPKAKHPRPDRPASHHGQRAQQIATPAHLVNGMMNAMAMQVTAPTMRVIGTPVLKELTKR